MVRSFSSNQQTPLKQHLNGNVTRPRQLYSYVPFHRRRPANRSDRILRGNTPITVMISVNYPEVEHREFQIAKHQFT